MNRPLLLGYQLLIAFSDTAAGVLLMAAPEWTMQLMHLRIPPDSLPFLSFIGAFVFAVGLSCLYGALLLAQGVYGAKIEMVWLLTAITRGVVAIFIVTQVIVSTLEVGWLTVAVSYGACAVIQATGLSRGWLRDAA